MGSIWRSEEMQCVQLFVQIEAAHDTVDELGHLGIIQFKDLNPDVIPFQRNFVNEVKRCDELERKLKFFEDELDDLDCYAEEERPNLQLKPTINDKHLRLDDLESQFTDLEKELEQMNTNQETLSKNYCELIELRHVLTKDSAFFSEVGRVDQEEPEKVGLLSADMEDKRNVKLGFITGVVLCEKMLSFERVLWRSTRGNLFMKHTEIEEELTDARSGNKVRKDVFVIFFQGERAHSKIKKICESFGAQLYPCPNSARERKELLNQITSKLEDLQTVLERTHKHRQQVLEDIATHIVMWKSKVAKEKAIYDTMNKFNYDLGRRCLIAEGWCPKNSNERITAALRRATSSSGALVPSILSVISTKEQPPTYFMTNKFTVGYQNIIDAYGIARYREVNPAVFSIITFPFLFAVMFGDVGHGILLTMVAAFFILKEKQLAASELNEMIKTAFGGRYVLLFMGIFSIYTGALYNEAFSVAIDFGSHYYYEKDSNTSHWDGGSYPFGVDPGWNGAKNTLNYYNSVKMKLSIILGVSQMCLGIGISFVNAWNFRKYVDLLFECIPQIIFMLSLFGYLCFLIVFKWCTTWGPQPPYLLNVMIEIFLSPLAVAPENRMYDSQLYVQLFLLVIAMIMVPIMLFGKPYTLKYQHKSKPPAAGPDSAVQGSEENHHHGHDEEDFEFGEVMVHQAIHTIEFVLGAISNTASYLRLWALSLAHSELSAVLYDLILHKCFAVASSLPIGVGAGPVFVGVAVWSATTFGILMIMESLSAFLHALRLHWVEFMNKFYKGDGQQFIPFSYQRIFTKEDD